jgi:hypothetical protein
VQAKRESAPSSLQLLHAPGVQAEMRQVQVTRCVLALAVRLPEGAGLASKSDPHPHDDYCT